MPKSKIQGLVLEEIIQTLPPNFSDTVNLLAEDWLKQFIENKFQLDYSIYDFIKQKDPELYQNLNSICRKYEIPEEKNQLIFNFMLREENKKKLKYASFLLGQKQKWSNSEEYNLRALNRRDISIEEFWDALTKENGVRDYFFKLFQSDMLKIAFEYSANELNIPLEELNSITTCKLLEILDDMIKNKRVIRPQTKQRIKSIVKKTIEDDIVEKSFYYNAKESLFKKITVEYADPSTREDIYYLIKKSLDERERNVISWLYGLRDNFPRTLTEAGKFLNISRERTRQIRSKAIHKLREPLKDYKDADLNDVIDTSALPYMPPKEINFKEISAKSKEEAKRLFLKLGNQVQELTTLTLDEFKSFYNLSREEFAKVLSGMFKEYDKAVVYRLITLSEKERELLKRPFPEKRYSELGYLQITLNALKHKASLLSEKNLEQKIFERMRNAYFPLFIKERKRCVELLESRVAETKGKNENGVYKKTLDFFLSAEGLFIPTIRTELNPYQRVDVLLRAAHDTMIHASDTGIGKSLIEIAVAEYNGVNKILIIATKSGALATWKKELLKHLSYSPTLTEITGDVKDKKAAFDQAINSKYIITTYNTVINYFDLICKLNPDMIIVDEGHRLNNFRTNQTNAIKRLNAPKKVVISGSIFKNGREELWPILNWLYPEDFPSLSRFINNYCKSEIGLHRLRYELRDRMICRLKEDVLDLPEIIPKKIELEMNNEEAKEYDRINTDFLKWYKKFHGEKLHFGIILDKLHNSILATMGPKYRQLNKLVDDILEKDEKAVIYTTYRSVARFVESELIKKCKICYIDGSIYSSELRAEEVRKFEKDPAYRIFIITNAGGESLGLETSNNIITLNRPLTWARKKQIIDRVHRMGQTKEVKLYDLLTINTIDNNIELLIERKRQEYYNTIYKTFDFAKWFEENEEENLKTIVNDIFKSKHY